MRDRIPIHADDLPPHLRDRAAAPVPPREIVLEVPREQEQPPDSAPPPLRAPARNPFLRRD